MNQPVPQFIWRGDRAGIVHAFLKGRPAPAVCGTAFIDERWAWPGGNKCPACVTRADELGQAALRTPVTIGMGFDQ